MNISPNNHQYKIGQTKQYNYLMPNTFKSFQGITEAAGTKFNQNWGWEEKKKSSLNLCTGRPPTGVMIPDAV